MADTEIQTYREDLVDGYNSSVFWQRMPPLTFNGPLLGSAVSGEKVTFGDKKERPYLVGWSLGWGFSHDAAALSYLEVAATVSPTSGFRPSRPYVGISLDGELFTKRFDFARTSKTPATDPW